MFWQSVFGGFSLFLSWRILLALVAYVIVNLLLLALGGGLFAKQKAAGCLFHTLIRPALGAILISLFVVWTFPIMFGRNEFADFEVIRAMFRPTCVAGVFAFVAVMILSVVPVLGTFIAYSPTLPTFIQGAIVFRIFIGAALKAGVEETDVQLNTSNLYPSLWATIGYVLIAAAIARLVIYAVAVISTFRARGGYFDESDGPGPLASFLGILFGCVGGFVPLFMYIQHVRYALTAAIH